MNFINARNYSLFAAIVLLAGLPARLQAQSAFGDPSARAARVEQSRFIQIPGPNPVLTPGPKGAWDDYVIEAADAFEDVGTYYFYFHGVQGKKGYQLGVATASSPLGPFKKYDGNPILKVSPPGAWDDQSVACAMVLKEGGGAIRDVVLPAAAPRGVTSGKSGWRGHKIPWAPGKNSRATPSSPAWGITSAAWSNPAENTVFIASRRSAPPVINSTTAPLRWPPPTARKAPIRSPPPTHCWKRGEAGDWDDGGISEAEVLYHGGMYHMFYGGTKLLGPRLESIGYAYSFDGLKFFKFGGNPVAARQANPNAAAFAEVHAIMEPPFIYLYHTPALQSVRRQGLSLEGGSGNPGSGDADPPSAWRCRPSLPTRSLPARPAGWMTPGRSRSGILPAWH